MSPFAGTLAANLEIAYGVPGLRPKQIVSPKHTWHVALTEPYYARGLPLHLFESMIDLHINRLGLR